MSAPCPFVAAMWKATKSIRNSLPQGFLVEQPPGSVTPPHFHEVNQFQVFVGGTGKFGKKDAAPLMIHYSGGHTPYGPIAAGPEGVSYFTLRAAWDPGAKYLPQSRDLLKPVARRHRLLPRVALRSAVDRSRLECAVVEAIHAPEADGLAAYLITTPPDGIVECPSSEAGGGQYHVVVGGSLSARWQGDAGAVLFLRDAGRAGWHGPGRRGWSEYAGIAVPRG